MMAASSIRSSGENMGDLDGTLNEKKASLSKNFMNDYEWFWMKIMKCKGLHIRLEKNFSRKFKLDHLLLFYIVLNLFEKF